MYTVNKGPSKFVTKTRPGLIASSHLDAASLTLRRPVRRADSADSNTSNATNEASTTMFNERLAAPTSPSPRPVFHATLRSKAQYHNNLNSQYSNGNGSQPQSQHHQQQYQLSSNNHHQHSNNNHHHPNHHQQHQHHHPHHHQHNGNGAADALLWPPQHEELVQFVLDSWTSLVPVAAASAVDEQAQATLSPSHSRQPSLSRPDKITTTTTTTTTPAASVFYAESPNAALKDFGAFDLDAWWGRRLFQQITRNA